VRWHIGRGRKRAALASCSVLLALVPAAASAEQRPAKILVSRSSKPNGAGWHSTATTAAMRLRLAKKASRIDLCSWSTLTHLPDGDGYGFARYWRRAKVSDCRISVDQAETGLTTMQLTARDDGWSVSKTLTIRVDLEEPTIDADDPPLAFTGRTIALQGTVADAFSGPGSVVVRLTSRTGAEPVVVDADCDDCGGSFRGCSYVREPACGWSSPWHVEARVEPGIWSAVVEARDVAGNIAQQQPIDLIVLP